MIKLLSLAIALMVWTSEKTCLHLVFLSSVTPTLYQVYLDFYSPFFWKTNKILYTKALNVHYSGYNGNLRSSTTLVERELAECFVGLILCITGRWWFGGWSGFKLSCWFHVAVKPICNIMPFPWNPQRRSVLFLHQLQ